MSSKKRGFTLLEIVVVIALASILATTFCSVMYLQMRTYMERLDEVDAHQQARAVFSVVRYYVQGARYGMALDKNSQGTPSIGECYNTSDTTQSQRQCFAVDGNNDRLRLVGMLPDTEFIGSSAWPSAGPCMVLGGTSNVARINVTQNPCTAFSTGTYTSLLAIAGPCSDTNIAAASDLLTYSGDAGSGDGCSHRYYFTRYGVGGTALTCATGYAKGFGFGRAQVTDLYTLTDSTDPNLLTLMLRTSPRVAIASADPIAYNLEYFRLTYQIDTSTPMDQRFDATCRDPRSVADGGSCALTDTNGNVLTTQQIYNRIVGVTIYLGVRTAAQRVGRLASSDGYRHWNYTSSFSLRNNSL